MIKPFGTRRRWGQPRRRAVPLWRSRPLIAVLLATVVATGAGSGWWLWRTGTIAEASERLQWRLIAATTKVGFRVEEILVIGRRESGRRQLLEALRVSHGAPILAFNAHGAKRRVEALPWVRYASVERMLPNTILLRVVERTPLAIWQHQGRFALIDGDGTVILRDGLERYSDLLVVVGEDAPAHAAGLLDTLSAEPHLMRLVEAAIRVGGRRWNVRLVGGIYVHLPERDASGAWSQLAEYDRTHRVLETDVQVLDMRLPDRLIIRKLPEPASTPAAAGRET